MPRLAACWHTPSEAESRRRRAQVLEGFQEDGASAKRGAFAADVSAVERYVATGVRVRAPGEAAMRSASFTALCLTKARLHCSTGLSPSGTERAATSSLVQRGASQPSSRHPVRQGLAVGDWEAGDRPNVIGRWIAGEGGPSEEDTTPASDNQDEKRKAAANDDDDDVTERKPFSFKEWDAAKKPRTDKVPVLVPLKKQLADKAADSLDDRQVVQWELGMEWRLGELGKESDAELVTEDAELKREQQWLSLHQALT